MRSNTINVNDSNGGGKVYSSVVAHVDLAALQHNCNIVKNKAPHSRLLAIVKSNAYGHGVVPVAHALYSHVDGFGVSCISEALQIRQSGGSVNKPLLLLKGVQTKEELELVDALQLATVVHDFHQIELLEKLKKNPHTPPINVWFKIDTGMHRLGFQLPHVMQAYERLMINHKVAKPLFVMTHISDADDVHNPKTAQQINCFQVATDHLLNIIKCVPNSGALWNWEKSRVDWVRSGILLYGASPSGDGTTGSDLGLKPVMTLTSKLLTIQHLKKGDQVGYGSTWSCPEDMPVGVIDAGYGDGYSRHSPSGTPTLINGKRCPIVGRVSMDMISVDLRPYPGACIGDEVVLWGRGLPIEEVANLAGTVPHELLCHVTRRVHFEYTNKQTP